MSLAMRVLLFFGAFIVLYGILREIGRKRIQMRDAIFWVVLAGVLLLFAIFPGIVLTAAWLLGVDSPSNLVFLGVIAVLLVKLFSSSAEISMLKHRVDQLAEEVALTRAKERERDSE